MGSLVHAGLMHLCQYMLHAYALFSIIIKQSLHIRPTAHYSHEW